MMFEHVLIVEDQDVTNLSLRLTLQELQIPSYSHAYYCDVALSTLRKGLGDGHPYDLMVTDLYFEVDGTAKQLPDGFELITSAKALQPSLKVLVFSTESRTHIIRELFDKRNIEGFVRKGRGDAGQLKVAIDRLSKNQKHYPREYRIQHDDQHDFTQYDKTIIRLIADGHAQIQLPAILAGRGIAPSGLRTIEKRLSLIRTAMGFKNNEQLVAYCTEMRLI